MLTPKVYIDIFDKLYLYVYTHVYAYIMLSPPEGLAIWIWRCRPTLFQIGKNIFVHGIEEFEEHATDAQNNK